MRLELNGYPSMDDQLREYLLNLLDYGVTRYVADNGDETGFKLWQNYRMDQVQLKILKNPGYNAVGTYYYDDYVVIFASLKKDLPRRTSSIIRTSSCMGTCSSGSPWLICLCLISQN